MADTHASTASGHTPVLAPTMLPPIPTDTGVGVTLWRGATSPALPAEDAPLATPVLAPTRYEALPNEQASGPPSVAGGQWSLANHTSYASGHTPVLAPTKGISTSIARASEPPLDNNQHKQEITNA